MKLGIVVTMLFTLACAGAEVPEWYADLSGSGQFPECHEQYTIYSGPNILPTETFEGSWSAGTLEQQVLENDAIVHTKVLSSEFKIVETDAVPFEILSFYNSSTPPYPKYMTVVEVELAVLEYLNGEGPDRTTAVIEGQVGFEDWEARHCAKSTHEHQMRDSDFLDLDEGIAYLKSTDFSDVHYLGLLLNNFSWQEYSSNQGVASSSVWLPFVGNGEFYSRHADEWVTLEDARRRVTALVEELGRYPDDEDWRGMRYGLAPPIPVHLPKQIIHFRGEDAPIEAGTAIWQLPWWSNERDGSELTVWLEGKDADRFEITYLEKLLYGLDR